jgi:RNA polymerase sigma-70 factor (ECF subfamily)
MIPKEQPVTALLKRLSDGDRTALDDLIPIVYRELHNIAQGYLWRELPGHTLQPTSLIHEAYLRLVRQPHPSYMSRAHFYGVAARIMRQILVDHARSRQAAKRGGGEKITLTDAVDPGFGRALEVVALDRALHRLAEIDERKAQLVEMRFFGGMTAEEIGESVGLGPQTIRRELRLAQAWLHREVSG